MHTGLMIFDNSSSTLAVKIQRAADKYQRKLGRVPELCLVHPQIMEKPSEEIGAITVRPWRYILPDHLWIGVEEEKYKQEKPEPLT